MNAAVFLFREKIDAGGSDRKICAALEFCRRAGIDGIPVMPRLYRTSSGKPYVENGNVFVSVTHTPGLAAVAVSDGEIGVDAERSDRVVKNYGRICESRFSRREKEFVRSAGGDGAERFLQVWVKKEAYLKYTGQGLSGFRSSDVFSADGCFTKVPLDGFEIWLYTAEIPAGPVKIVEMDETVN